MATQSPAPPSDSSRRSSRENRGTGGHDAQLGRLSDILVAPTRQRKRPFTPDDPGLLPVNPLAPLLKTKWKKWVRQCDG